MISWDRLPQVIRTVWIFRLIRLLGIVSRTAQITVEQPRCHFVDLNRPYCRHTNEDFSTMMMSCPINCSSPNFRLKYWWHRLRSSFQSALYPIELDGIQ